MFKLNLKRWVGLVGLVALTGVLLGSLFVGPALAQGPTPQTPGPGWGHHGRQPGMMAGRHQGWDQGFTPASGSTGAVPYGYGYGGGRPGMMGNWGYDFTPPPGPTGAGPHYGYGWADCAHNW